MNAERWQRLKEVFQGALEQDPANRTAFLDRECAGDAALRDEVEVLIAKHEDENNILDTPVYRVADELLESETGNELIGRKLGSYSVIRKIGRGGMGIVYLAEDTRLGRLVAIKALAPEHTSDPQHRERFRREARIAATLSHPGIATAYALEEYDGDLYIIYEYVRGQTLQEELSAGQLPTPLLLDTGIDVARALTAAHEQGIIHRDIKPENVKRTPEGSIKILDFGLARIHTPRRKDTTPPSRVTIRGAFHGTIAYASPEQLLGLGVDFRTDIFSFGIMMYEMASGTHPFMAADSVTTMARILEAEPAGLESLDPMLRPGLEPIVRRCLQKSPEQRYSATRELVADLERLRRDSAPAAESKPLAAAPSPGPAPAARLRPLWWWQFHQVWVGLMYYVMLLPMWKVKEWTPGGWGALIFFMTVAAVGVAANLRIHLWFTSIYYPAELDEQVRRVCRLIRCADILFVAMLLTGAVAIHGAHEVYTTLLIAVAIGSLGAFLLIEPTTARAAFEKTKSR